MMKLTLELQGSQTETHCSLSSSINACEKLNHNSDRCLLFKTKLDYDFNEHAYKRCDQCISLSK